MRIASAVGLGRRFFKVWGAHGPGGALRIVVRYAGGQLRLWAAYPARVMLRRKLHRAGPDAGGRPSVSIIMSTWNRAAMLPRAVDSVLAQRYEGWELIVVDDGSDDDTPTILATYARDPRIRTFRQDRAGSGAARNFALAQARGDIIAYIDSDNEWCPDHLAAMLPVFHDRPDVQSAYGAIRRLEADGTSFVHLTAFDAALLAERNFIDLNVYCHRRRLWEELGGFDPALPRLNDWDLVRRYSRHSPPRAVPVVGAQYHDGGWPRLSNTESKAYAHYLILRKDEKPVARPLKVLYALWHYPQLSESYIETEIAYMRRRGIDVEVWSEITPVAPHPVDVPVHRGSLKEVLASAKPDIVHIHWLGSFGSYEHVLRKAGLPVTVRAHGFEFTPELASKLNENSLVRAVFVFPQHKAALPNFAKLQVACSAFDPTLYRPLNLPKDRRLVLRVAAGLPTKDFPILFRLAKRLPEFRFVLSVVTCNQHEAYVAELLRQNEKVGRPVDLRINMSHPAIAALAQKAGIYLHTYDPAGPPYGMPISIAESMACGAYLIARRLPPTAAYVGEAGDLYDSDAEAEALLRATLDWSEEQWRGAALRSIDRAFRLYVDRLALKPIFDCWQDLAQRIPDGSFDAPATAGAPIRQPTFSLR
jgi:glycosyltransferase involved in cell wall biosynthesis